MISFKVNFTFQTINQLKHRILEKNTNIYFHKLDE